jgi:RND superfamily putative drug exporter
MEGFLGRLAGVVATRRREVLAIWLAFVIGCSWFSLHQTDRLSGGGWDVPGSQSVQASNLLDRFPAFDGVKLAILVEAGSAERAAAAVERANAKAARFSALTPHGKPQTFDGGRAILVPLVWRGETSGAIDFATRLRHAVVAEEGGARTRVVGEPAIWSNFQEVSKRQLAEGEAIGLPLVLLILVVAFGTLVAAAAPAVLAILAVLLTGAVIYLLSGAFEMSIYVTNMASMIGIGVAVDYSLFVVSRFRRRLGQGLSVESALRDALVSSGTAVVFSGATVVVSLGSLFLVPVNAVRSMAVGAIVVVSIAVLATVTLLPALLALVGRRVERLPVRLPGRKLDPGRDFWLRWTTRVMRRPVVSLTAGAALMIALAVPALTLRTENHGLSQLPPSSEVRAATERAESLAGPGFLGPVHIIARNHAGAEAIAAEVRRLPDVVRVVGPIPAADGSRYLVDAVLSVDPDSRAARTDYQAILGAAMRIDPDVVVGGATAFSIDIEKPLVGGLWKIALFILACSYVVLLLLLRSVLLPLKAVFMNLLSVGAAYGVLVAIFQWGWLDWTGYDSPGYLDTIVPALVLAVVFGLSMDYEVFLLTRIRERYELGVGNERAVSEGLAASARIITAAALIMVAVFGAFSIAAAPSLKELGVGLAVAVFLDATIVRLIIVPATMRLLGDWNWWLPSPLAAIGRRSAEPRASER